MHSVAYTAPAFENWDQDVRQKWLKGIIIYVIRSSSPRVSGVYEGPCNCASCGGNKQGKDCFKILKPNFVSSSPCEDCTALMKKLNIKKIAYSCDENKIVYTKFRDYKTYGATTGKRITF